MAAGGKGDARRPTQIPDDEAQSNWDRIFRKTPEPTDATEQPIAQPRA